MPDQGTLRKLRNDLRNQGRSARLEGRAPKELPTLGQLQVDAGKIDTSHALSGQGKVRLGEGGRRSKSIGTRLEMDAAARTPDCLVERAIGRRAVAFGVPIRRQQATKNIAGIAGNRATKAVC